MEEIREGLNFFKRNIFVEDLRRRSVIKRQQSPLQVHAAFDAPALLYQMTHTYTYYNVSTSKKMYLVISDKRGNDDMCVKKCELFMKKQLA